jgi:ABC-type dipeptide/oligopeptide/nickel transport system ATPase component
MIIVDNVVAGYRTPRGLVKAIDRVSLEVRDGEILGIVGESGCGKSVTARAVLQILDHPGRIVGGEIWFDRPGLARLDIAQLDPRSPVMAEMRGK